MLTDTSPVSWFTSIDSDWATSEVDWLKSPLEDSVVTWLKAAKDSSAVKFTPSFSALSTGSTKALLKFRSEEHTSELQSLMRISYAVFCLKKKTIVSTSKTNIQTQ